MHRVYHKTIPKPIYDIFSNTMSQNNRSRDLKLFDIPYTRLKSTDNTISVQGPQMYNAIVNLFYRNRLEASKEPLLQNNFTNRFKNLLTLYLLDIQSQHGDSWCTSNFFRFSYN